MARHSLADWLKNASDDTLKSSGLGRKAAGVQNVATDARKRNVGGKAKAQQPEHNMQVKLISEIRKLALVPEYKDLGKAFAIPNGGKRNVIVAQKMKAEGVRAGVPDLCLPVMRGGFGGMYVELKAGKNTTSDLQDDVIEELRSDGYYVDVFWSWEEALAVMIAYVEGDIKM